MSAFDPKRTLSLGRYHGTMLFGLDPLTCACFALGIALTELAALLSEIERDTSIRPDGGPLEPGAWDGWLDAIAAVKRSKS